MNSMWCTNQGISHYISLLIVELAKVDLSMICNPIDVLVRFWGFFSLGGSEILSQTYHANMMLLIANHGALVSAY